MKTKEIFEGYFTEEGEQIRSYYEVYGKKLYYRARAMMETVLEREQDMDFSELEGYKIETYDPIIEPDEKYHDKIIGDKKIACMKLDFVFDAVVKHQYGDLIPKAKWTDDEPFLRRLWMYAIYGFIAKDLGFRKINNVFNSKNRNIKKLPQSPKLLFKRASDIVERIHEILESKGLLFARNGFDIYLWYKDDFEDTRSEIMEELNVFPYLDYYPKVKYRDGVMFIRTSEHEIFGNKHEKVEFFPEKFIPLEDKKKKK